MSWMFNNGLLLQSQVLDGSLWGGQMLTPWKSSNENINKDCSHTLGSPFQLLIWICCVRALIGYSDGVHVSLSSIAKMLHFRHSYK